MKISQAPREGMYANWNNTLRLAEGKYVYILTSDDTMYPDCLEKMVHALEEHQKCDLCSCNLDTINEEGEVLSGQWKNYQPSKYFGSVLDAPHIRRAPHDVLCHAALGSIHISITQLLIRRSFFQKCGEFLTAFGSEADFEWNFRASFLADKIHVPEFLATWRRTSTQATSNKRWNTVEWRDAILEMIETGYRSVSEKSPESTRCFSLYELKAPFSYDRLTVATQSQDSILGKLQELWAGIHNHPGAATKYISKKLRSVPNRAWGHTDWLRASLTSKGYDRLVEYLPEN